MRAEIEAQIAAFVKERNYMLLKNDVDLMIAFFARHNPEMPPFSDREVAEVTLHKARSGARGLPREAHIASKLWLRERGYSDMADDLP